MSAEVIRAKVARTEGLRSSVNGTPNFMVALELENGDIIKRRTSSDAQISYAINNPEYRDQFHDFHLTPAARIMFARSIDS